MSKNEVKFKTYSSFKNFREDEEKGILYIEGYASKSYHNGKPVVDLDNEFMGGEVEQTFRPIMNQYIAKEIVDAGGIGLKENIMRQMNKYEEAKQYGQ